MWCVQLSTPLGLPALPSLGFCRRRVFLSSQVRLKPLTSRRSLGVEAIDGTNNSAFEEEEAVDKVEEEVGKNSGEYSEGIEVADSDLTDAEEVPDNVEAVESKPRKVRRKKNEGEAAEGKTNKTTRRKKKDPLAQVEEGEMEYTTASEIDDNEEDEDVDTVEKKKTAVAEVDDSELEEGEDFKETKKLGKRRSKKKDTVFESEVSEAGEDAGIKAVHERRRKKKVTASEPEESEIDEDNAVGEESGVETEDSEFDEDGGIRAVQKRGRRKKVTESEAEETGSERDEVFEEDSLVETEESEADEGRGVRAVQKRGRRKKVTVSDVEETGESEVDEHQAVEKYLIVDSEESEADEVRTVQKRGRRKKFTTSDAEAEVDEDKVQKRGRRKKATASEAEQAGMVVEEAVQMRKRRKKKDDGIERAVADVVQGLCRQQHCLRIPVGDREITLETGSIGRQADGAVTVSDGETILYATACVASEASEPSDFAPLYVHYQERYSAAGRTSGGFVKREGKPKDNEVIVSRLVDRALRPLIPARYFHEIQVLSWVLSYDGKHLPEPLAITAAGAALALSDVPVKPVAGVRVGLVKGKYVLNPTAKEMANSKLDLVVAGTIDKVLSVEGYCDFLTEDELLEAVELGLHAVTAICKKLDVFGKKFGREKNCDKIRLRDRELENQIQNIVGDRLLKALHITSKKIRAAAVSDLEKEVCLKLAGSVGVSKQNSPEANIWIDDEEVKDGEVDQGDVHIKSLPESSSTKHFYLADVKLAFKELTREVLRTMIVKEKVRSDGRGVSDIRLISSSCGLLPRTHGSAIFTRGETQALVVAVLGDHSMAQRVDTITEPEVKRFYVQYAFPPSCVGEVDRMGPVSRREIGHGMLIERALKPIFPENFPYTVRLESMITESNGSSSMASVCGGYLALRDAGVPVKCPIAGVNMGLILDPKEHGGTSVPVTLTDLLGSEDAFGDMDLKIAGSEEGITAFQMDLKIEGVTVGTIRMVLRKAKTKRLLVLKEMTKCVPPPSGKISKQLLQVDVVNVDPDRVTRVVGSGGRTVKQIIEESGVETVDVNSDGSVVISGTDSEKINKAKEKILSIATEPVVGAVYRNCLVKALAPFGCFVEILPGREGLCHVSELSWSRINRPEDYVAVGEHLDVKIIDINSKGQIRLSHKALMDEDKADRAARRSKISKKYY